MSRQVKSRNKEEAFLLSCVEFSNHGAVFNLFPFPCFFFSLLLLSLAVASVRSLRPSSTTRLAC